MPNACVNSLCPCTDNPFANLSSERPDRDIFIGYGYSRFSQIGCFQICFSEESQEAADLCSQFLSETCGPGTCPDGTIPPCDGVIPDPPQVPGAGIPNPPSIFSNAGQNCVRNGSPYSIGAGSVWGWSQLDADARAHSICTGITGGVTPPVPPPGTCPVVTATSPASPATVIIGSGVIISATVQYSGTDTLVYLWLLDGIPYTNTLVPTLFLDNVQESDSGTYQLQISAPGCSDVYSAEVQLEVVCAEDSGTACPTGATPFEIIAEVEWETFSVVPGDFTPIVSSNPICNPTGLYEFEWPGQPDTHPPGTYELEYVSGFFEEIVPTCGDPVCGWAGNYGLLDAEHDFDNPVPCNNVSLLDTWAPGPAFSGALRSGINRPIVQGLFDTVFLGKRQIYTGPPGGNFHTVNGGKFRLEYNEILGVPASYTCAVGYELTFKIIQVSGVIHQEPTLSITDWATKKLLLPADVHGWSGSMPRTIWTDTNTEYEQPAALPFGGATAYYTQAHPTSPNSCGWIMEIEGSSGVVWIGYKVFGDTAEGQYMVADISPNAEPSCLYLA